MTSRELSPDAAAARLAEGLLDAGRGTEALAAVRRAIALNPENKEYEDLLGQVIEAGGNCAAWLLPILRTRIQ